MITKFNYYIDGNNQVARKPDYSFTAVEDLSVRLSEIDNDGVISSIAAATLKGESERGVIDIEEAWFKVQTGIQAMDDERVALEKRLQYGDNGFPLTPDMQANVAARIAECKEGTVSVTKEFYNHYTRETMSVVKAVQTEYTIALETRAELEAANPFLGGHRGVAGAPARPAVALDADKEKAIRKELVRQKIYAQVGDLSDLLADVSNALSATIKKVNGQAVSADEQADVDQYVERQATVNAILDADYVK